MTSFLDKAYARLEKIANQANPERRAARRLMQDRELYRKFMEEGKVEIDGEIFVKEHVYPKY